MMKSIGNGLLALLSAILFVPALFVVGALLIFGRAAELLSGLVQDFDHAKAKETAKDVANIGKLAAAGGKVWMWASAPSTLTSIGAKIGIASMPAAFVVAPVLISFAAAAILLSAALDLYSKWKRSRKVEAK